MTAAFLFSALLSLHATQPAPRIQPHFSVTIRPAAPPQATGPQYARTTVCGMVVMRQTAESDPKMLIAPRQTGAAVRRIQPQACGAAVEAAPK